MTGPGLSNTHSNMEPSFADFARSVTPAVLLKTTSVLAAGWSVHTFLNPPNGMGHSTSSRTAAANNGKTKGESQRVEAAPRVLVPIVKVCSSFQTISFEITLF